MTADSKEYSQHVFILPFLIKNKEKHLEERVSKNWEEIKNVEELPYFYGNALTSYAHQRYFNSEAEEIMYNNANLVRNYRHKPKEDQSNLRYLITYYIENENKKEKKDQDTSNIPEYQLANYDLKVDYILLRYLPNMEAAFLIYGLTNDKYEELRDIRAINQYGRRTYDPFLAVSKQSLDSPYDIRLVAEHRAGIPIIEDTNRSDYYVVTATYDLLADFFNLERSAIFPEKPFSLKDGMYLDNIIDDRMFVVCHAASDELTDLIQWTAGRMGKADGGNCKETRAYLEDLYKWAFIDIDDATCTSEPMLEELLADTLYTRWSAWNSLYMATQHSMVFLSNTGVPPFLVNYFLSEYLDMVLIVLSQRLGILKFSHDAGANAEASSEEILRLQRKYVTFQNQYLLPELSGQEQAVDIYNLLQKNLYIEKHIHLLDNQLKSLNEISQTEAAVEQKKSEILLNWIMLALTVATLLPNFFSDERKFICDCLTKITIIVLVIIAIILLYIMYKFIKKRIHKKN